MPAGPACRYGQLMQDTRSKILLGAAMVAIGGVGLGIGLHIWWPVIAAAVFVALGLGVVYWR